MNSFEGNSGVSVLDTSAKTSRVVRFMMEAILLDFFVTGQTFDLLHFINSSLTISFEFITKNKHYLFDFILHKLKGLLNLVLFGKSRAEGLYFPDSLFEGIILLDID